MCVNWFCALQHAVHSMAVIGVVKWAFPGTSKSISEAGPQKASRKSPRIHLWAVPLEQGGWATGDVETPRSSQPLLAFTPCDPRSLLRAGFSLLFRASCVHVLLLLLDHKLLRSETMFHQFSRSSQNIYLVHSWCLRKPFF